jgi:hypothetical protein
VRQQQAATEQAVAAAAQAAAEELQGAKAAWQGGEAARRVKFLGRKAEDATAATLEGLAPELDALKVPPPHSYYPHTISTPLLPPD